MGRVLSILAFFASIWAAFQRWRWKREGRDEQIDLQEQAARDLEQRFRDAETNNPPDIDRDIERLRNLGRPVQKPNSNSGGDVS